LRPDFRLHNFVPFKINDLTGESTSHVTMTKDGFTFLAMGFTGAAAGLFKEKYIAAFNVMEAELRRRMAAEPAGPQFQIPQTLPEALRLAADLSEKVEEQKAQIEAAKPKTVFYDKFVEADGLYGYMNGGRALGCHPTLFVRWLKRTYVFYEGSALLPYLKWRADGVVRDHVRNWRRRQGPASRVDNAEGAGISVDTHPARD
jgi:phage regulator Rha-like protein